MNYLFKILENVKNGATTLILAEKQVLDLFGISYRFNEVQLKRISKMLKECAFSAWNDSRLTTMSFDEWWTDRNKLNGS